MRFFVYVNENPSEKHITIHCETNGPCGDILKQIIAENTTARNDISTLPSNSTSKEVIKFAETDNSYWLIIWAQNVDMVFRNKELQKIAGNLGVSIDKHNNCCPNDSL